MRVKKKLLIADDNESIHDVLSHALYTDGFDIIHSYDGRQTLKLAKEELPDLIILDILMPLVDGRDICKKLKTDHETKNTKIIMLTGKAEQFDRILGFELGADDYIPKPFSRNYLRLKIRRVLDKK